jgi:hypothetical protein
MNTVWIVIIRSNDKRIENVAFLINDTELPWIDSNGYRLIFIRGIRYEDVFGMPHGKGLCPEYRNLVEKYCPAINNQRNYRT